VRAHARAGHSPERPAQIGRASERRPRATAHAGRNPDVAASHLLAMKPNGLAPVSAAALVVRLIDVIDKRSDEQRDALLMDLLSAAWGNPPAQNQ